MDEVLLLLLILGWAAVLLPSAVRSRRSHAPHVTVGGFEQAMAVLRSRPDGREIMVPDDADRIVGVRPSAGGRPAVPSRSGRTAAMLQRRRAMFVRLLATTGAMLLLAIAFRGVFTTLFLLSAAGLAGYVGLLRHFKHEQDQAREVVRTIDLTPYEHDPRDFDLAREPVAVGAGRYAGLQVATHPDEPWEPQSSVRIRRWDD